MMGVWFENNCTVSEKWNVCRVIARLPWQLFEDVKSSAGNNWTCCSGCQCRLLIWKIPVRWLKVTNFRSLFYKICVQKQWGLFLIQVEDLDTEVPSSVAVRMEYLFCLSILMLWTLCEKRAGRRKKALFC